MKKLAALLIFCACLVPAIANAQSGVPPGAYSPGAGVITNGAGTNPIGSLVNVKASLNGAAGAVGDTHFSRNCTTSDSSAIVTNATDAPWVAADVGKFIEIINTASGTPSFTAARKIASFQSTSQVTLDAVEDGAGVAGSGQSCKWFTKDDTAAFVAAWTAAKGAAKAIEPHGSSPTLSYPSGVYCPPGGYTVSGTVFLDTNATTNLGISFMGDPSGHCVIYPTFGFVGTVESTCAGGSKVGLVATCQSTRTDVENIYVEGSGINFATTSISSNVGIFYFSHCAKCRVKDNSIYDVGLTSTNTAVLWLVSFASSVVDNNFIQDGTGPGISSENACELIGSQGVLFSNNTCSNHAASSLVISGSGSRGSTANQVTVLNHLSDECGASGGVSCTVIQTGSVVNIIGGGFFGGAPALMSIDTNSSVYAIDANIQSFGAPATNVPAISIAGAGFFEATGTTLVSNGTSAIFSAPGTATFVDTGGNTFLNCTSGTCAAITPANFATRGFSGGIIPKTSLTHTPNTCTDTLGTVVATVICNTLLDQNYQILNITASSNATTTCATAPIVTISDGTQTATLTLTTAKSSWSSAVDTSSGIDSVFAKGNTMTITYDLSGSGACVTPPTNLAVSYVLQSVINF